MPFEAKSCGTLISLAAKTVHMGPASQLGPIDPALGDIPAWVYEKSGSSPFRELAEAAIDHMRHMAITAATSGLMAGRDAKEIKGTVEKLMDPKHYPSHGYAIDQNEAKGLNFNVKSYPSDDELWRMIWLLYCIYVADARRDGFGKFFESAEISMSFFAPQRKR